jgi:glycosyltransferase involved in cell wall biosynthesis
MDPAPLHLLCIEPRFPGRLGVVADWLVRRRGYRCQFYCNTVADRAFWPASVGHGLEVVPFNVGGVARAGSVDWTRLLERGLCYAYGCWEVLSARRGPVGRPDHNVDLVLGRSAMLGSTLFTSVFQPGVPVVNFFDYYLAPRTGDLADEDAAELPPAYTYWRRSANVVDLLDLENGVHPWVPTAWQRDQYPPEYRDDFLVLFDGVDVRRFARPAQRPRTVAGRTIPDGTRVVSFVASGTDRRRGFDSFVNLVNRLVRAGEDVVGIAVGAPVVQNGLDVRFCNQDYQAHVLAQDPPPDLARLWLLGALAPPAMAEVLAVSDLHVYPSRPGPASRSLVEAMAAACVLLAWDTPAVREFVTPGTTGLCVASDDMDAAERAARQVLRDPAAHQPLGETAAELVRVKFGQDVTLPALAAHFDKLRGGRQ